MLAFVYAVVFLVSAGVLVGLLYKSSVVIRVVLIWALFMVLGFFTHAMLLYAAIFAVAYYFRKEEDVNKIFLFLCLLTVMPPHNYDILNLGIWWTNYQIVLAICLLLPMCLRALVFTDSNPRFSKVDLMFFVFVAFQCLLQYRANSLFSAFQLNINLVVTMLLPYLAVTRLVKTDVDVERVVVGLIIGIGLLSVLAVAETLFHWRLYVNVQSQLGLDVAIHDQTYYYRHGLLRTGGGSAFNPLIYAYLVNISILGTVYFIQQRKLSFLRSFPFLSISLLALFFTGSRAGLLCLGIGLAYLFYDRLPRFIKLLAFCAGLGLAAWGMIFVLSGEFASLDREGTFQYRIDLFNNSLEAIAASPFVGYSNVNDSPAMRHSIQGQGIIDLVNTYLIFALNTGLTGLFLFIALVFTALRDLSKCKVVGNNDYKPLFFSIFLCTLVYISTTSLIGFMVNVFWVLLSLCLAYTRVVKGGGEESVNRLGQTA